MDLRLPSEKKSDSDVNGTVVVNMFTLEVAVEDIDTAGEKAGKTTAHEILLMHAGWKRHHCFGAAVQKGEFRAVSGFINGLREGYKIVTAPAYNSPHSAFGQLQTDRPSETLDAFKKFTEDKENREKAEIPEEARASSTSERVIGRWRGIAHGRLGETTSRRTSSSFATTVEESKTKQKHDVTEPYTQCVFFHRLNNLSQETENVQHRHSAD